MLEDRHKNLLLAISTEYVVTLNAIGFPMDHMTEIHNMIGAPVTCVECRTEPNQMAVGLEGCIYGGTNEGYKVSVYRMFGSIKYQKNGMIKIKSKCCFSKLDLRIYKKS